MKLNPITFLICILLVATYACTPPATDEAQTMEAAAAPDLDQIKSEIQALEDAYAAGMQAKDANAVAAFYSDDAVSMGNNEPSTVGRLAILERTKANIAADTTGASSAFEVQEIIPAGDYVIEVGKSVTTYASGSETSGKYLAIFEKRDGKYQCIRDIWNENAPPESN